MTTIMVVDDDPGIVFILKTRLTREGYEVIEAYTGEECLQKIEEVKPDLVLLDTAMPDINGWEVCKRIKENQLTSSIPIAMLSIRDYEEDKKKSFEYAHADEHLIKSIYLHREVMDTVNTLLEKTHK
jgi:DNA-binding response OmpR family regulator